MQFKEAIHYFPTQFSWQPEVHNKENLKKVQSIIVCGMGGSALAADILKIWKPELDLMVHRDYGLPALPPHHTKDVLVLASSYSGNTEEALDAFEAAKQAGYARAASSTGGELIAKSKTENVPYVQMPAPGIEPRSATGFSTRALLALLQEQEALDDLETLAETIKPNTLEPAGKQLAERLKGHFPVIYASTRNLPLAYNWKSRFNETGKIAAFINAFPELNHNETMGFDFASKPEALGQPFAIIMLRDEHDHPRVKLRMDITANIYEQRGIPVIAYRLQGSSVWEKLFSSLVVADWAAYYTGLSYGLDVEGEHTVENFKRQIGRPTPL